MRHLTIHEAAEALQLSVPTIKRYIYGGKLKSVKLPGGQHRIPESEIAQLLAEPTLAAPEAASDGATAAGQQERIEVLERWVTELEGEVERLTAALEVVSTYCARRCDAQEAAAAAPSAPQPLRLAVLGPGCRRCNTLHELTVKVLKSLGRDDVVVERLSDLEAITAFGPVLTPALVLGDTLIVSGRVPPERALRELLADRLG